MPLNNPLGFKHHPLEGAGMIVICHLKPTVDSSKRGCGVRWLNSGSLTVLQQMNSAGSFVLGIIVIASVVGWCCFLGPLI